jgi:hypothetical protein
MRNESNLMKAVINTIFSDPSWKFSDVVFPNLLAWKEDLDGNITIIAVVALRRVDRRGADYALGEAGLKRVLKPEQISEAYVVLGRQLEDKRREFVAAEKATVVRDRLRDYGPQNGGYGSFWWITVDFMPASTMRLASDAPF